MNEQNKNNKDYQSTAGVSSLYQNNNISMKVQDIVTQAWIHIDEQIKKYMDAIDKGDKPEKDLIKNLRKYIDEKASEGFIYLSRRNRLIAKLPGETEKQAMNGMKDIEDFFKYSIKSMNEYVEKVNSNVILATYDNQRKGYLKANTEELDKLLKEKDVDDVKQHYNEISRLRDIVIDSIDEEIKDINKKIASGKYDNTKLENQKRNYETQRQRYIEQCDISQIQMKQKLRQGTKEVIAAINNHPTIKKINDKINALLPNFNIDNILNNQQAASNTAQNMQINQQMSTKELKESLEEIQNDLISAKNLVKASINLNLDVDYDDKLSEFYDKYFDSRINTFQNLIIDITQNEYRQDKNEAVKKAEKIIKDYSKIRQQLNDCYVPEIYKYYHQQYFRIFEQVIQTVKNEYEAADYTTISFGGQSESDYIIERLKIVKQNMNAIIENYKNELENITKLYNDIVKINTGKENEQIREIEDSIRNLNIKGLFDDYINEDSTQLYNRAAHLLTNRNSPLKKQILNNTFNRNNKQLQRVQNIIIATSPKNKK